MILRIGPARPCVVGRKDRADQRDDGESVAPVIADRIGIPPCIALRGNLYIEARSVMICCAASIPERVAIGTPAPG